MNLEIYEYTISRDQHTYWFFSHGPKGRIKKCVEFKSASTNTRNMFNLGFGDWDERTQSLNDSTRSNNGDTDKVLATVAHVVLDFTGKFPNAEVFASGTAGRIRLYRMNIARRFLPIYTFFNIFGVTADNVIEPLTKNNDYVGFIVKRRPLKRIFRVKT
jgi:hypothetical protein